MSAFDDLLDLTLRMLYELVLNYKDKTNVCKYILLTYLIILSSSLEEVEQESAEGEHE